MLPKILEYVVNLSTFLHYSFLYIKHHWLCVYLCNVVFNKQIKHSKYQSESIGISGFVLQVLWLHGVISHNHKVVHFWKTLAKGNGENEANKWHSNIKSVKWLCRRLLTGC